jgi:hypothetical protein
MHSTTTRSDFADWLSPMLVKELRQGIRSKIFMSAFYLTQVLMILSVIFSLLSRGEGMNSNSTFGFLNGLFWFMIGVPLIFLMPLRGFGALYGEIKAGTLELVFLTRLSALRIAAGKWTALIVQTLLLVTAVLPYVLLRYFLGGVNVVDDLQSLFFLLLASAMLTAATIALSPYESKILRALFSIGMIFGLLFLLVTMLGAMASRAYTGSASGSSFSGLPYLGAALFTPAFIFLCLEIAASRIAPPAENHALRKRLIGLYLLGVAAVLILLGAEPVPTMGFAMLLLTVVVIDALAEPHQFVRSVYRPFLRWGLAGRMAALCLTPGWVTATWFVGFLTFFTGGLLWLQGQSDDLDEILKYVAYLGLLIFPAALIRLWAPTTKYFLGFYIAQQFFFAVLTLLVSMMAAISREPLAMWLSPLPPCAFFLAMFNQVKSAEIETFLLITSLFTAASLGILIARSITPLRDIRKALGQTVRQDA